MLLRELFEAEKKVAVAAFGRLNPPTTGHKAMVDEIKKIPGDHFLFLSHSQGAKNSDWKKPGSAAGENKDPLSFEEKLPLVKQAFPDVNVGSADVTGPLEMAVKLYKMGYTDLIVVAGSDRMPGYKALFPRYNGESGPHGEYNFNSIEYVELTRDEDAEGVSGMSASKLRQAVRDDDFDSFKAGLLAGNAEDLFKVFRERLAKDSVGLAKQEEPEMAEDVSPEDEDKFHNELDDLVHKYFGDSPDEEKMKKRMKKMREATSTGYISGVSNRVLQSYLKKLLSGEQGAYEKNFIEKIKQELEARQKNAKMRSKLATESDLVLNRTSLIEYLKDQILSYIEQEDDIDKLSQMLLDITGKKVKSRGGKRYTITSEDTKLALEEACKNGMYYCSTDKKMKCRQGPKKSRG